MGKGHYKEHIESIKILQKKYPKYKEDLNPSIYDFCCVALFKSLLSFEIKNIQFFLLEGLKASKCNPFKFFRALIWGTKFFFKKNK